MATKRPTHTLTPMLKNLTLVVATPKRLGDERINGMSVLQITGKIGHQKQTISWILINPSTMGVYKKILPQGQALTLPISKQSLQR